MSVKHPAWLQYSSIPADPDDPEGYDRAAVADRARDDEADERNLLRDIQADLKHQARQQRPVRPVRW